MRADLGLQFFFLLLWKPTAVGALREAVEVQGGDEAHEAGARGGRQVRVGARRHEQGVGQGPGEHLAAVFVATEAELPEVKNLSF